MIHTAKEFRNNPNGAVSNLLIAQQTPLRANHVAHHRCRPAPVLFKTFVEASATGNRRFLKAVASKTILLLLRPEFAGADLSSQDKAALLIA